MDLTYANGRVKGSTSVPGPTGIKTVTIDTTYAPGTIDDNMLSAVIPGLRWVPGAKYTANAFDASSGTARAITMSVAGTESITVPAGTFETYRVEQSGGQQTANLWITTAAPHRLVKMTIVGTPLEFVLAK